MQILEGDSRDVLLTIEDNSIDACVTDPPYALNFMGREWDDCSVVHDSKFWFQVLCVLKPGGHLVAFGGTRTSHRMICAIEDAGFEIRDSLMWIYGTGFPKSQNVSLAMDKQAGAIGHLAKSFNMKGGGDRSEEFGENGRDFSIRHEPVTEEARTWTGFGTALKPAFESIVLARKPLSENTVAANVLKWGTGALNIDATRIQTSDKLGGGAEKTVAIDGKHDGWSRPWMRDADAVDAHTARVRDNVQKSEALGRWPANVVHDGSDEVVGMFPQSGPASSGGVGGLDPGMWSGKRQIERGGHDDNGGSAARFFYSAKADSDDRLGSRHPTIKPVDLMQWLCRLVTPPQGIILDPFAGSGTTGEAAYREGFSSILIERDPAHIADIRRRLALLNSGPDERKRESIKARLADTPPDYGPLFANL